MYVPTDAMYSIANWTVLLETLNSQVLNQHTHQLSDLHLDNSRDCTSCIRATPPLPLRQYHQEIICDLL